MKTLRRLAISAGRFFDCAMNRVALFTSDIGGLALFVMMLIVVIDVVRRYGFNAPSKWTVEFSTYLMVVLVFLGMAYALKENAHIRVDFLMMRLPKRVQEWMDVITPTVLFGYTVILIYLTWQHFMMSFTLKSTSGTTMDVIIWPVQLFIPVGFAIMSLLLICNIYAKIKAVLVRSNKTK